MLEKIKVVDFQKHKKLVVKFDPHVTTIVGDTDAGKSAFLRSLAFVGLNLSPKGRFIRFGKGSTSVILHVDGHRILRKKGKGSNVYILDGSESYRAVNTNVPSRIAEVLNLAPINFQWQRDPPFWFADTSGQVSRNLNEIINLGSIDRTLGNVNQELKKVKSMIETSEQKKEGLSDRLREITWVPGIVRDFNTIRDEHTTWRSERDLRLSVAFLLASGTSRRAQLDVATDAGRSGEKLLLFLGKLVATGEQKRDLGNLVRKAGRLKHDLSLPIPDLGELSAFRAEADQVAEDRRAFEGLLDKAREAKERLCQAEKDLSKSSRRLKKKLKGKCPVCGRKLKSSASVLPTCTRETKHLSPVERRIGSR